MRMVVAVIKDGRANYLLAEGKHVDQLALVNVPPSFDVEQAVRVGLGLIDDLALNGDTPSPPKPARATVPKKAPAKKAAPKGMRGRQLPVTREDVLQYVREHPGKSTSDIAQAAAAAYGIAYTDIVRSGVASRLQSWANSVPPLVRSELVKTPGKKGPGENVYWPVGVAATPEPQAPPEDDPTFQPAVTQSF